MKIIILGAGQVGTTLAEQLATEHNDITIIDLDNDRLRELYDRMDIHTINGNASYPNILKRAGAEEADMIIAVTSNDETNIVACQIAYTLFQIPTKIARIRSLQYLAHEELFGANAFPIDVLISPEQIVTNHIQRLIEYPNALQVLDFANQKIQLVAVKIRSEGGALVGFPLKSLPIHLPNIDARVVCIYRQDVPLLPNGNTVLELHDEVYFLAEKQNVRQILSELIRLERPYKRIFIAGGGNIGTRLATSLQDKFQVKIIENNPERVEDLATQLKEVIVLEGDASDKELLQSEHIEDTDVFCAVTNHDETNIMSALLAKRLKARKVMALIVKPSLIEVVEGGEIDIVISPQQATIGSLLTHVRRGHIVNVHSLRKGTAEAIEVIADGTKATSNVIGRAIKDIDLPQGCVIGAVYRKNHAIMGHHNVIIESGDHVIVFLADKRKVRQVERLFQENPE